MKRQKKQIPNGSPYGSELAILDRLLQTLAEAAERGIARGPSARRKAGLASLREAQFGIRYIGPLPRPSAEEEEQWIADVLYAEKLEERAKRDQKQS